MHNTLSPYNPPAPYDSDKEYRAFLRRIIQMDPTKFYETEEIKCDPTDPNVSEETIDEYNYDAEAVAKYLDSVSLSISYLVLGVLKKKY